MATIKRFEDIEAWQLGRDLKRSIHAVTKTGEFAKNFALKDQIRRAAISITANIAEGFERDGNREFIQFLSTSKGSCGELQDHLYTALDEGSSRSRNSTHSAQKRSRPLEKLVLS